MSHDNVYEKAAVRKDFQSNKSTIPTSHSSQEDENDWSSWKEERQTYTRHCGGTNETQSTTITTRPRSQTTRLGAPHVSSTTAGAQVTSRLAQNASRIVCQAAGDGVANAAAQAQRGGGLVSDPPRSGPLRPRQTLSRRSHPRRRRDRVSARLLRTERFQPRLQALDRRDPERV